MEYWVDTHTLAHLNAHALKHTYTRYTYINIYIYISKYIYIYIDFRVSWLSGVCWSLVTLHAIGHWNLDWRHKRHFVKALAHCFIITAASTKATAMAPWRSFSIMYGALRSRMHLYEANYTECLYLEGKRRRRRRRLWKWKYDLYTGLGRN